MTPKLHTSTSGPSYFFPWNSSGAAYGGLPQKVSSLLPGVNSLLKPKSAILMFMLASRSRFSAWRCGKKAAQREAHFRWSSPSGLGELHVSDGNTELLKQSVRRICITMATTQNTIYLSEFCSGFFFFHATMGNQVIKHFTWLYDKVRHDSSPNTTPVLSPHTHTHTHTHTHKTHTHTHTHTQTHCTQSITHSVHDYGLLYFSVSATSLQN